MYSDGAYHGPGKYTTTLNITANSSLTLASGIYVLMNGINISANATVNTAPGGVLLDVRGGAVNFTGNAAMTLSPLTTGPYAGVLVWQHSSGGVTFSGNAGTAAYVGTVYAPTSAVDLAGNSVTNIRSLITLTTKLTGNGVNNVG